MGPNAMQAAQFQMMAAQMMYMPMTASGAANGTTSAAMSAIGLSGGGGVFNRTLAQQQHDGGGSSVFDRTLAQQQHDGGGGSVDVGVSASGSCGGFGAPPGHSTAALGGSYRADAEGPIQRSLVRLVGTALIGGHRANPPTYPPLRHHHRTRNGSSYVQILLTTSLYQEHYF
jgi:hypothetical protein